MISYALATMMLVAASNTAPVRQSYARCLKEFVREGVEKKMEVAAFSAAFDSACRDKEASFKNAMVESEVKVGIKRAVAEQGIQQEIADYRVMAKEEFQAELASPPKN